MTGLPISARRDVFFAGGLPYPLTICRTRYGGVYEGGEWAAFTADQIPDEAVSDDVTCSAFWGEVSLSQGVVVRDGFAVAVGWGATAVEAVNACTERARWHNRRVAEECDE